MINVEFAYIYVRFNDAPKARERGADEDYVPSPTSLSLW
jgi:hypothetical protein